MASFNDNFGGGESITMEMLEGKPQTRIVRTASVVDGYSEGDPPRIRLDFEPSDEFAGLTLYGNNAIRLTLVHAVSAGEIPDEMDDWNGVQLGLYAGPIKTPNGTGRGKLIKVLDGGQKAPGPSQEDDEIPF